MTIYKGHGIFSVGTPFLTQAFRRFQKKGCNSTLFSPKLSYLGYSNIELVALFIIVERTNGK